MSNKPLTPSMTDNAMEAAGLIEKKRRLGGLGGGWLSLGALTVPCDPTADDFLNYTDRQTLEYGLTSAAVLCNVVSASDDYEAEGSEFYQAVIHMAGATLQARATVEAARINAAAIDRNTVALQRLISRLGAGHASIDAANDAGQARPGAVPESDY